MFNLPSHKKQPKLHPLNEDDNIEHFLITFERIAAACRWPKSEWAFHLIPLLTGKARSACVHMDVVVSMNYDDVKCAILQKYDINCETYRQRFRSLYVKPDETPKELYTRLKDLYGKWIRPKGKSVEEISDMIILEQYLRMLSPDLQVWVKERDPKTASEAASLAEAFVAARGKRQSWAYSIHKRNGHPADQQDSIGSRVSKPPTEKLTPAHHSKPFIKKPICYLCGQEGHTKPKCPQNAAKFSQMCFVPRIPPEPTHVRSPLQETSVEINGQMLKALIDTGSTQTLVQSKYVSPHAITPTKALSNCCVHGDEKQYPTAHVYFKVRGQIYLLNVGVADSLPYPVVLGHDLPVLLDLLHVTQGCNVAVTRAQAKQNGKTEVLSSMPFFDADIEVGVTKVHKSRKQRRREKFLHNVKSTAALPQPDTLLGYQIPGNISELQHQDEALAECFKKLERYGSAKTDLCIEHSILYQLHGAVKRLMVPRDVRDTILSLGHSIPWAGHMGKNKTLACIQRWFHWPGLQKDVTNFCKSCPQCQKTSSRFPSKALLQPLPIISTPFERLGMDIVGPVKRSKYGNRFMLVITDYATKYPEVFALKSVKAKTVASCLVQFFSRVGFPKEILTDQGTNFMSKLLKDVYQLLGIKSLRTTPYHPQTDGLTERFNQTLKQMLRKFTNDTGSDWDQWLSFLLFAYREVPQASTGFSPFELLFGHDVRGPLALFRETWDDGGSREPVNVVSYVLKMRERLEKMSTLAQEHMVSSQANQKTWYDKRARTRSFCPGQKVLVMLPSVESKLLAKWQGPFEVMQKLGPTTYKISVPDNGRSSRVLHVNLLKEWIPGAEEKRTVTFIRSMTDEEVEEQYLPTPSATALQLSHLSDQQQLQQNDSDQVQSGPSFVVVVAIDFGTTSSGYAYAFTKEPECIHTMR
ncbi:uncharacterized protein LOC112138718 [Oryzias melastigma]|uniref:uncharacterized protein LOC112138718 n=1 Tax=Oryzias melastigma TaxID=30732 RepID=UPI000CF7DF79|nr:uncharacterized protein LOC112138718 [Oryzias melastigma]